MTRPIYTLPDDLVINDISTFAPNNLWHLPKVKWEQVWQRVTGKGVKVSINDTGISNHIELPKPIATRSFISGQSVADGNGHGTHVSGTAVGRNGLGVAPDADLIIAKVLSDQGSGGSDGIADAIRWSVDQGADIVSMSLGGGSSDAETNQNIDYAWSKGCYVTAAAGNSGFNGSNTIGWPAKYLGCLCTASYQQAGGISSFSSGGREIDWACPGSNIISANTKGGYATMSGTSMATPFGAGLLALIRELQLREGHPIWTSADQAREFFKLNCEDSGQPGFDVRFGWGKPMIDKIIDGLINDSIQWI
jgi:subtilisin